MAESMGSEGLLARPHYNNYRQLRAACALSETGEESEHSIKRHLMQSRESC